MADEAFALSPISARATLPSEEDYAAISEAFMETSRGRWFLTEYAKRNRNADTRMVLDAVARIEQSLAAQKEESLHREESLHKEESLAAQQQAATAAAAAAAAENSLAEALAAIRSAVEAAQASAFEALDSLALEQRLAPVRKGARVIREIAWRLREIGNDGRICDLIDSQVAVIEKGTEQISSDEASAALNAAFAALEARLAAFDEDERAPPPASEAVTAPPSPAPQQMPTAAFAETIEEASALEENVAAQQTPETSASETSASETSASSLAAPAEAALAEAEAVLAQTEPPPAVEAPPALEAAAALDVTDEAADAHDEAVLDMIAMEMGAPDAFDGDEFAEPMAQEAQFAGPPPVEPAMTAQAIPQAPEPVAAPIEPPVEIGRAHV